MIEEFKTKFNDLFAQYPDEECIKWAKMRVADIHKEWRNNGLQKNGSCLLCKANIEYTICDSHRRYKDKWLQNLRKQMRKPFKIIFNSTPERIKFYRRNSFSIEIQKASGYLCRKCISRIEAANELHGEYQSAVEEQGNERALRHEQKEKSELIERRNMPYSDFLKTEYWKYVRGRALRSANYHCQLCKSKKTLHVHHKTYENRGNELNHMKDLIVLCANCHETFHNHGQKKKEELTPSIKMPSALEELSA